MSPYLIVKAAVDAAYDPDYMDPAERAATDAVTQSRTRPFNAPKVIHGSTPTGAAHGVSVPDVKAFPQ